MIEVEQPRKADRRGRGKSDPIDAHWAAVNALRRDADALPTPPTDGAREGLRILLVARGDLVTTQTRRINQLRALLLLGGDTGSSPVAAAAVTTASIRSSAAKSATGSEVDLR